MNLDYRILWFEDDRGSFTAKQRLVKRVVNDFGFSFPEPQNEINGDGLDEINFQVFDLIIADLNLSNEKGSSLLDRIRKKDVYTEAVFYSSEGEAAVREELRKFEIDGVYCAGRENDDFITKVQKVIQTTIKKVQDVNNIRGLVIAETIELEHLIEKILLKFFLSSEEVVLSDKKIGLLESIYNKKVAKHETDLAEIKRIQFTEVQKLVDQDILTAANTLDALQSILKDTLKELNTKANSAGIEAEEKASLTERIEQLKVVKKELNNFQAEVIKVRNTLAHVEEQLGEDGKPFLKSLNSREGTVIVFDDAKYVEIRNNLKKHRDNLTQIITHLGME